MDVNSSYHFDAPAARVWEVMLDPDVIAKCMPGCEKLTPLGNDQYEAIISVGVGAVRGSYTARITVADQVPMHSYRLVVEGTGAPGFVRGVAHISLEDQGERTLVKVDGDAQVGGTVARVGQRLIGNVNRMMMDRFFTCLQEVAGQADPHS